MSLPRLLAVLALAVPLSAQSWDALSGLRAGDTVKVLDTAGQEHRGTFRNVSAGAIALQTAGSEESIDRPRVRQVQVRSGSHRVRNALIGAAVGVAIGVTVDQSLGAYLRNESGQGSGVRALTYIAPIGILGGIGALLPSYRTVYRVR